MSSDFVAIGVMSERVAIVVGAGGELGRATAEALAGSGYTVVGVDRNEQGLKELSDGIRREVGDASAARAPSCTCQPARRPTQPQAWRPTASARRLSAISSAFSTRMPCGPRSLPNC